MLARKAGGCVSSRMMRSAKSSGDRSGCVAGGGESAAPSLHGRRRPSACCVRFSRVWFSCLIPSHRRCGRLPLAWACSAVLAAEIRASSDLFFDCAPRRERHVLPKEGAERRKAHPGCLPFAKDRRRLCEAGSPYGAPLRRLKSLVPHFLCPALAGVGRLRDIDPRPHNGPGGCLQDSRDHGQRNRAQAPLPLRIWLACADAPLSEGG